MLCEKCNEKPATIHITRKIRSNTGDVPDTEVVHHFCEACGREFMQNSPDFKSASFSQPKMIMELHRDPSPIPPPPAEPQIDTSKRYDVYCIEPNREVVVYRNARFKGAASLLPLPGGRMRYPGYIELEQANGQSIFIPRSSVFRFCEPGTTMVGEVVGLNKPEVQ